VSTSKARKQGHRPHPECQAPQELIPRLAMAGKALSDENRIRILLCVCPSAKAVSRVVEEVGLSQPLVSHHLKELRRAGLVSVERSGPFVFYQAIDPAVKDLLAGLAELVGGREWD